MRPKAAKGVRPMWFVRESRVCDKSCTVQQETLGAYKTEVTIFTGRSLSISESHLENVLWALFNLYFD